MIIDHTDFLGQQAIAQISNQAVRDNLKWFIDEYEPAFLKSLLGETLAVEFTAGIALDEDLIEPKWKALRDDTEIKRMLICYVYYWYIRNATTTTMGTGEGKAKQENSNSVPSIDKQVQAWNTMVKKARNFRPSTLYVYAGYPGAYYDVLHNHCCHLDEIYEYQNTLNI